ncbi:hypothetical protein D3C86_895400 [compost metagenome]
MRQVRRHPKIDIGEGVDVVVPDGDGRVVFARRDVTSAQVHAEHIALPACAGVQPQFGHAQTERIALRLHVLDLVDAIVGRQAVHPCADQAQRGPPRRARHPMVSIRGIGHLCVDAVRVILGQVQEGGHGPDQIARGIAFDLGAEFSIPLMASSHQVLRRDGGDHVVDRDAVVVERQIQPRDRRR